jgi:hypothetical protein
VKIVASGGFTVEKIEEFERHEVPGRRVRRGLLADSEARTTSPGTS